MSKEEGYKIVTVENYDFKQLQKYHEKGALRGVFLGYTQLNEIYTMALPGVTDWTGSPQSGKTELLLQLLLNTSLFYGWKHVLYAPDIGTTEEIISLLVHKMTGKTFDKRYKSNYIDWKLAEYKAQWILQHFIIIEQETKNINGKIQMPMKFTPYEFWILCVELNQKDNMVKTGVIDSWKDLKHYVNSDGEKFNRDDLYLGDALSFRNFASERYKMHFHQVIHPLKTEKDKDGKRQPPGAYDMKGGTEWFNNGKVMITVHRESDHTRVIVTKAKPKSVAKVGESKMYLDVEKNQYYEDFDGNRHYANINAKKPLGLSFGEGMNDSEDEEDDLPF